MCASPIFRLFETRRFRPVLSNRKTQLFLVPVLFVRVDRVEIDNFHREKALLLSAAKAAGDTKKHLMIEETTPDVLNAKGLLMFLKQSPSASSTADSVEDRAKAEGKTDDESSDVSSPDIDESQGSSSLRVWHEQEPKPAAGAPGPLRTGILAALGMPKPKSWPTTAEVCVRNGPSTVAAAVAAAAAENFDVGEFSPASLRIAGVAEAPAAHVKISTALVLERKSLETKETGKEAIRSTAEASQGGSGLGSLMTDDAGVLDLRRAQLVRRLGGTKRVDTLTAAAATTDAARKAAAHLHRTSTSSAVAVTPCKRGRERLSHEQTTPSPSPSPLSPSSLSKIARRIDGAPAPSSSPVNIALPAAPWGVSVSSRGSTSAPIAVTPVTAQGDSSKMPAPVRTTVLESTPTYRGLPVVVTPSSQSMSRDAPSPAVVVMRAAAGVVGAPSAIETTVDGASARRTPTARTPALLPHHKTVDDMASRTRQQWPVPMTPDTPLAPLELFATTAANSPSLAECGSSVGAVRSGVTTAGADTAGPVSAACGLDKGKTSTRPYSKYRVETEKEKERKKCLW